MTSVLKHRGPDADGHFFNGFCGLGNRRLKVIDLSDTANQPFHSSDNRYVMVYNGEVYNYAEIASQLKKESRIKYNTSSDTEIIINTFVHYGIEFLQILNGMFSIAIFDKLKNELFIFRDRVGIKPLYYYWNNGNLAFASELKSLTQLSDLKFKIDKTAFYDYLHLGYIPVPKSAFKNIYKLDAGCYLRLSGNDLSVHRYWNLSSKISSHTLKDETDVLDTLEDLMNTSVKYQMKSDVPFGVFLSGGIDSSLVAALAAKQSPAKVNTFSIGFQEQTFN